MRELMKIDVKKFNLKKQPLYFLIAMIPIALLIFGILYVDNGALIGSAPVAIDVILKPVFIIWEAVLISTVVIDEFKNKTILMLYTYPIDKRKLIVSKVLVVAGYSFIGIMASQIVLNLLFCGIHQFIPAIPYTLTINDAIGYVVSSVMVIMLGLIPLSVGLVKYSTIATLVTSIMIVLMGSSSGMGFDQLLSETGVVVTFGGIGIAAAVYSIFTTFNRDIIV